MVLSARHRRSIGATAVVLVAVFAVGALAGFLLEHDPAPDERRIVIDRTPPPAGPESTVGGEVVSIDGGALRLRTTDGFVDLELGDVVIEELARVEESAFEPGDTVNLGGHDSDFGVVLSGVVEVDPR